jgi:hypothetical protein
MVFKLNEFLRYASTSREMIERIYASHLEGEMSIEILKIRRNTK